MGLSIRGRVALVTGGARGIGAGIVNALADAGAKVMVSDIGVGGTTTEDWSYALANEADLAHLLDRSGAEIAATHVDVTDAASCEAAVAATLEAFGQMDILVNNAGVVDTGPIGSFDEEAWDKIFAVNTKGIFLMTRASVTALRASDQACIVNTASIAGRKGYANMSAYCGSKFAAIGITQSLATELAPDGIRVNALCPGMVGTAMWLEHLMPPSSASADEKTQDFTARMEQTIPLGRPQTVQDMGDAVLYLVTAENVSGVALNVDGGFEMN